MAGFGGSVKLTGESEYRKALKSISDNKLQKFQLHVNIYQFLMKLKFLKNKRVNQSELHIQTF